LSNSFRIIKEYAKQETHQYETCSEKNVQNKQKEPKIIALMNSLIFERTKKQNDKQGL
jgi:hypothetical protein